MGNSSLETPAPLDEIQDLLRDAMAADEGIRLLKGFKMDFSGNQDFHKVFFSVRCTCGTAAILSVEVAKTKTLSQVRDAVPSLVGGLKTKSQQFAAMPCEMHARMRSGSFG